MYNDYWLLDKGLTEREHYGDFERYYFETLRRQCHHLFRTRRYAEVGLCEVSSCTISLSCRVLNGRKVVGIIDESDLLLALYSEGYTNDTPVKDVMTRELTTLLHIAHKDELAKVLNAGLVAIVEDSRGDFEGLITRIDFINYLHQHKNYRLMELTYKKETHDPQLKNVSETLLVPLFFRAKETLDKGIIRDEKAVDIVCRIDYDFQKMGPLIILRKRSLPSVRKC